MWKRLGFVQHADEFWVLAKLVLERLRKAQGTEMSSAPSWNGVEQHDLNYDESEMSQVSRLIEEFRFTSRISL